MRRALIISTCLTLLGALLVIVAPAASASGCTTSKIAYRTGDTKVSSTPVKWATTDGNVITAEYFGAFVAIGGNFTHVIQANGTTVAAGNFAILNAASGDVVQTATIAGYPRTMKAKNGILYVGGSFTSYNGIPRKAVFALNASTFALLPWAPTVDGGTVRDIEVSTAGVVYLAGNGSVAAISASSAARIWTAPAGNGVVRALLLSPDQQGLYVGGDFNTLKGVAVPQLAAIYPVSAGTVATSFHPVMRPSSAPGGHDGELVLELRWSASPDLRLVVGFGGSGTNGLKELHPSDGSQYWSHDTEGDSQGLAVLGNTILKGQHLSHLNQIGCGYNFFGDQWTRDTGYLLPWNPKLSMGTQYNGKASPQSVQSEANGGISDIMIDPINKRVLVVGDFAAYGGTCTPETTLLCTGTSPLRGLAVYGY